MNIKIVLPFLTLVALSHSHDLIVGQNNTGRKIFDETKQASPAVWRQVQNVTVSVNGSEVISQVVVNDQRPEKDGDAKIIEGGEGQKNVTIELKSPTVLRGFDFHIEVYAAPEEEIQNHNKNMYPEHPSQDRKDLDAKKHVNKLPSNQTPFGTDGTTDTSTETKPNPVDRATDLTINDKIKRQGRDVESNKKNEGQPPKDGTSIPKTNPISIAADFGTPSKDSKSNIDTEKLNKSQVTSELETQTTAKTNTDLKIPSVFNKNIENVTLNTKTVEEHPRHVRDTQHGIKTGTYPLYTPVNVESSTHSAPTKSLDDQLNGPKAEANDEPKTPQLIAAKTTTEAAISSTTVNTEKKETKGAQNDGKIDTSHHHVSTDSTLSSTTKTDGKSTTEVPRTVRDTTQELKENSEHNGAKQNSSDVSSKATGSQDKMLTQNKETHTIKQENVPHNAQDLSKHVHDHGNSHFHDFSTRMEPIPITFSKTHDIPSIGVKKEVHKDSVESDESVEDYGNWQYHPITSTKQNGQKTPVSIQ